MFCQRLQTLPNVGPQIGCSVGMIRRFIALKFLQTREVMMQVKRDVRFTLRLDDKLQITNAYARVESPHYLA